MIQALLAQTTIEPAQPPWVRQVNEVYHNVVTQMPPGGLGLMFVLIALTLVVGLWVVWSQRTLARNQVKTAELLERHLAQHQAHDAEHAAHAAEHAKK